jgi:signal transduction histidine kinase
MDAQPPVADRWVPALHNLYLATLLIAFVATITVDPIDPLWSTPTRVAFAGAAATLLAAADLVMRRLAFPSRPGVAIGYFVVLSGALGMLTAVCPFYGNVSFGALPLVFVALPPLAAAVAGVVLTTSPLALQLVASQQFLDGRAPFGAAYGAGFLHLAVLSVGFPILIGFFTARAVRALRRQSQAQQAMVEQLSLTRAELASASHTAGRAEERQRLAHELHDTLAQGLSGVIMQLEAAEQDLESDQPPSQRLAQRITRARETARSCLADTRRAVEALRPEPLDDRTLTEAITGQCHRWAERTGIPVRAVVRGAVRRLPPRVEVVAFRVVQESLANAAKHASAREVEVIIEYDHGLRLTVRDDGRGFDPARAPRPDRLTSGGHGLVTMRERVEAAGGQFALTSSLGVGTTVTAYLKDVGEEAA